MSTLNCLKMKLSAANKTKEPKEKLGCFSILLFAIILPISTTVWIASIVFFDSGEGTNTSPTRCLLAATFPIFVAAYGLKRKSLDYSGAVAGFFVGFIITYSSYFFTICLLVFFFTSSKATKFRSHQKKIFEDDYKEGGQRNWLQVLCNAGMATELALLYMIDRGSDLPGERAIDFKSDYRASYLAMGVMASLACSNGDTWASEFGSVIGKSSPYLITSWKVVPRGTNGGVSFAGLFFSAAGGFAVGLAYYCCLLITLTYSELEEQSPQWPVIIIGSLAGLFGSLVDSVLGATLQFSGLDRKTGRIVSIPAPGVRHVAGLSVLDNHSVNLISSVVTGLIVPKFAVHVWELF